MTKNYLKLQFYSYPRNQAFARDAVAAFCVELNPTLAELSDVKTAVSEAVTNCTVHAYRDEPGLISVECETEDGKLHIKVTDSGTVGYGVYDNADLYGRVQVREQAR